MRPDRRLTVILRSKPLKDVSVASILVGLLVACFVTLGFLYGLALPHRTRAQAFLHDFAELRLGESTFVEAQRLAREYDGIPWYITPGDMRCTFQRCRLAFHFDNMPLAYIPRVGYTQFSAEISVKDGIVVGREINYEHLSRWTNHFRYVVFDDVNQPTKGWEYGVLRLKVDPRDPRGIPHVLEVRLGLPSTADLKNRAYSLDLSCLAKPYGCGTPSALYPSGLPYLGPPYQGLVPDQQ